MSDLPRGGGYENRQPRGASHVASYIRTPERCDPAMRRRLGIPTTARKLNLVVTTLKVNIFIATHADSNEPYCSLKLSGHSASTGYFSKMRLLQYSSASPNGTQCTHAGVRANYCQKTDWVSK